MYQMVSELKERMYFIQGGFVRFFCFSQRNLNQSGDQIFTGLVSQISFFKILSIVSSINYICDNEFFVYC